MKVLLNDILYIESLKDYIKIHQAAVAHTIKHSIAAFQKILDERFLRIHRSFVINTDKITAYTKHNVEIGDIEIPIGESYRKKIGLYFKN